MRARLVDKCFELLFDQAAKFRVFPLRSDMIATFAKNLEGQFLLKVIGSDGLSLVTRLRARILIDIATKLQDERVQHPEMFENCRPDSGDLTDIPLSFRVAYRGFHEHWKRKKTLHLYFKRLVQQFQKIEKLIDLCRTVKRTALRFGFCHHVHVDREISPPLRYR